MLFSYNKNVNPVIRIGNNKINETSFTKFLGKHLDKKMNFLNHITEMSMIVAKSIGILYKLYHFHPEIILKMLHTSLIPIHTYHMVWRLGMEHVKIIPLKSSCSRRKPYVQ